jgi:hypothetical protein
LPGKVDHGTHFLATEKVVALSPAAKAAVRDHLEQILRDPELCGSRRCHHLLDFIVTEALDGKFQNLKERIIGEKVFGRLPAYDTGADAVVRVSANELRKRLAQYYLNAGDTVKLQVSVPAGSYVPEFRFKEAPIDGVSGVELHEIALDLPAKSRSWKSLTLIALSLSLVFTLVMALGLWVKLRQFQQQSSVGRFLPWTAILDGKSRTFIVLGDTGVGSAQDLVHSGITLDDYIRRDYLPASVHADAQTMALARYLTAKRITSLADAEIAVGVDQINPFPQHRPIIRFAREMQVDDFKNANAVILDSKRTNPWMELFQQRLNFQVVYDEELRRHVVQNRAPKIGEKALYVPAGSTGTPGEAYAVLALLPNLNSGYVLLIAGTNMEGTEATGEFAEDASRISAALERIGLRSTSQPQAFELFLRVEATGGTSSHAEVIAYRLPH